MSEYTTRNDLSANTKSESINILNARLADSIDLALLTKQAHWNIKGPQFIALHEMIDRFRTELDEHVEPHSEAWVAIRQQAREPALFLSMTATRQPRPNTTPGR
jgi:starvation-inducible DNA-binding protein